MRIEYHDTSLETVRRSFADAVAAIHEQGLVYPVTTVDGRLCCEGVVSYPAVVRAVEALLAERARA